MDGALSCQVNKIKYKFNIKSKFLNHQKISWVYWIFSNFSDFFPDFFWVYEDFMKKEDLNTEIEELFTPK